MKRWLTILLAAVIGLSLTSCSQPEDSAEAGQSAPSAVSEDEQPQASQTAPAPAGSTEQEPAASNPEGELSDSATRDSQDAAKGKILVAYFSWSGNTQEMASYISEQTGGDLLQIQPEVPYPTDYSECGDVALAQRDQNERPAIANLPESIAEYDTLIIGYPIWWHTAPMIIGTFLESYDLSGIDVYPFTQSDSMNTEQFDSSMEFVRNSAAGATVHDGLFVRPSDTEAIDTYLSDNGLSQ